MKVIPEAIQYIKLQRTEYANSDTFEQDFVDDIKWDLDSIGTHLPEKADSVLDIGCGVAGIDVLFSEYYRQPQLFLLDKTELDRVWYGFQSTGAFYNSLDVAKFMLTENGIPESNVHLVEAQDDFSINTPEHIRFDLVTSFISWGFHYPVETYLSEVMRVIADDGVLIVDLRYEADMGILKSRFNHVEKICQKNKAHRVVCEGVKWRG